MRQNDLSDFTNVKRNGKIAMNLPEGITLVNAAIADENDDIMLVTEAGRAIRFSTTEIRVFKSRGSTGVRGIRSPTATTWSRCRSSATSKPRPRNARPTSSSAA